MKAVCYTEQWVVHYSSAAHIFKSMEGHLGLSKLLDRGYLLLIMSGVH